MKSTEQQKNAMHELLKTLRPVFADAAQGDFSSTISIPEDADPELREIYDGFSLMLDVIHQQVKDLEAKNEELKNEVANREDAQAAILNVLEDLETANQQTEQQRLRAVALIAAIRDGLFAVDADGIVTLINEPAQKMFRFSEEEVLGKHYTDVLLMEDEEKNNIAPQDRPLKKAVDKGEITKSSAIHPRYYIRSDGTRFPAAITVSPIQYEGITIGALNFFRDISEEYELDRAKNEFISIASHQLRTPLTGIFWVIERFLKKEELTERGKSYLNDIAQSAQRLAQLVDVLLNVSRIEEGAVALSPEEMDVVAFLHKYLDECRPLYEEKGIAFSFEAAEDKLPMVTDISAMHNIIQSVVSNAIEYTPEQGKIDITAEQKDDAILITVTDNGIGIPRKEHDRIFEKFTRGENAQVMKPGGTGIGLYIATQAAKLMGGKIWFDSPLEDKPEPRGTRFYIQVPRKLETAREGKPLLYRSQTV